MEMRAEVRRVVGASRLGGGHRIAVRDHTGDRDGDGQQGTGQCGRRCEDHKDAGAQHGSEPDRG